MILDRVLGHPARWSDLAFAVSKLEDELMVHVVWRLEVVLVVGDEPKQLISVEVVPSIFSPHGGKDPICKTRYWRCGPNKPVTEGMYAVLWEAANTAALVWPLGKVNKK